MKTASTVATAAVVTSLIFSPSLAAQEMDLETPAVRTGYSIGVNIGLNLDSQGILGDNVDSQALIAGIRDALEGDVQLSDQEIVTVLQEFSQQQQQAAQQEAQAQQQAGRDFLADNAENPDVTTTDSGLQYMVLEEGEEGAPSPTANDTVTVHYEGTLIDGTVFDSSIQRGEPISFPLDGVIDGWTEGLQLMSVGDRYRFFIPPELAYGAQGAGQAIGPNETLIFEVELLGIEDGNGDAQGQ